jgi:hypothetical protein
MTETSSADGLENNHFQFASTVEPTYGNSRQHTEETKLVLTLQTSGLKDTKEFCSDARVENKENRTNCFTLQKNSVESEDSFERYKREAEELYQKHLERDLKLVCFDDATTCKQGSNRKSITPNKSPGILNLLTSFNGLTPEGMAHLLETQERMKLEACNLPLTA